jgi:hypothetical protein
VIARREEVAMTDLTPAEVRAMAMSLGVSVSDDDVAEVTHRLNAFLEALAPLAALGLTAVEPAPTSPASERASS